MINVRIHQNFENRRVPPPKSLDYIATIRARDPPRTHPLTPKVQSYALMVLKSCELHKNCALYKPAAPRCGLALCSYIQMLYIQYETRAHRFIVIRPDVWQYIFKFNIWSCGQKEKTDVSSIAPGACVSCAPRATVVVCIHRV